MSLAWRLIKEEVEEGRIIIDTQGADNSDFYEIQERFSKPLKFPTRYVSENNSIDAGACSNEKEHTALHFDKNSFPRDGLGDTENLADCNESTNSTIPSHEERLQVYLDDAAQKLAAAKAYRKALLSGKTKNAVPESKPKRQCHIYRDILMEKLSPKFAIPKVGFKELVDEVMEEEFPGYHVEDEALVALQREAEMMVTKMMCLAGHLADHASRDTVRVKDFEFLKFLFYKNREGCYFDPGC